MIAIWGANGFIGRHTVKTMLQSKQQNLRVFARDLEGFPFDLPQTANRYCYDFSDADNYIEYLRGCKTLILMVSGSSARSHLRNHNNEIERTVQPYRHFFEVLSQQNFYPDQIVYLSSGGAIYGCVDRHAPIKEDQLCQPISPYGKGKVLIEEMLINYTKNTDSAYTILRVANPVGLYGRGLVNYALKAAESTNEIKVFNDGADVRDYFAVEELAQLIESVTQSKSCYNQTYNVGYGRGHSVHEVLDIVEEVTQKPLSRVSQLIDHREIQYNVLDCNRIKNDTGWQAQETLGSIIDRLWRAVQSV